MTDRPYKSAIYDQFERVGKALGSRRRLELLDVLAQGERSVEVLAAETAMSIANASQHLQALRRARLVEARQEGTHVYYSLADERVFRLLQSVREVAQARLAEIEQIVRDYFGRRDQLDPVRMSELVDRIRAGDVVVLDVRPAEEYASGHIAGAVSVPLDALEVYLRSVQPSSEIVAYCRGPYCVFAVEAVEKIRSRGHSVRRLEVGFPDWQAAGLPVERGHP